VVIGVPPSEATPEEIKAEDNLFSPIEQQNNPFVQAPVSDSISLTKSMKHDRSPTDTLSTDDNDTVRVSTAKSEDTVKRSTVKVLRGILKKPRRFSKEVPTSLEEKVDVPSTQPSPKESSGDLSSLPGGVIPEISSRHSDDEGSPRGTSINVSTSPPIAVETAPRSPLSMQRSSLQLPQFDRMLFAIRGAELREQYMRGSVVMENGVL
jgi:hypothetical protein